MTDIHESMTLGDLITAHPTLARQLEQRGLDYCCGGARTLATACEEIGLDASTVAGELADEATDDEPPAWALMGVVQLTEHLESTHHQYLWTELPRLAALVDKIVAVHGDRHPELLQVQRAFREIRADLEPHLMKEERVLFPLSRQLASSDTPPALPGGTLKNPISVMLSEHDRVGELLAELRELTGGYEPPTDGCASYQACYAGLAELEADTHLHVHKENNLLFPAVVQLEERLATATR
ncbi:MAG: iron-sulfur cluster repair di-iron protein [Acidimicrobiia bacterium]